MAPSVLHFPLLALCANFKIDLTAETMNSIDHFDTLPAELILRICELQDCSLNAHACKREPTQDVPLGQTSTRRGEWRERTLYLDYGCRITDLSNFARTCRRHHILINPMLHRKELDDYRAFGLFWAAKHGRLDTLNNFLRYGGLDYINFTTFAGPIFSSDVCYKNDNLILRLFPLQDDYSGFWQQWDKWWIRPQWRPHLYDWKFSLLALAAMGGHDAIITRLLDCGADIHAPSNTLCACEKFAAYICRASPALTTMDNYYLDWAPLHYAVCHGHLSTTKLLLSRGARHDRELLSAWPNSTYSTLYTAAFTGHLPILEFLLDAGVAVGQGQGYKEGVALHLAVLSIGLVAMSTVKNLADESTRTTPPERSSATGLYCIAGDFWAGTFLLDRVAHKDNNRWRIYDEVQEKDLINAVQVKFEDLLLSRPLPLYPEYDIWRKQKCMVLRRLNALKEQIEKVLTTGTESRPV